MKIGLGTGSTAAFAVERVGELLKSGALKDIVAIPTSVATQKQAEGLGIRWRRSTGTRSSTSRSTAPTRSTPTSTW